MSELTNAEKLNLSYVPVTSAKELIKQLNKHQVMEYKGAEREQVARDGYEIHANAISKLCLEAGKILNICDPVMVASGRIRSVYERQFKRKVHPLYGSFVNNWSMRATISHFTNWGIVECCMDGIKYAFVTTSCATHIAETDFLVVDKKDQIKLYKAGKIRDRLERLRTEYEEPVLSAEIKQQIWNNTIGFLNSHTMDEIKKYGGRQKRGLLLSGPPGNGKTMILRWLNSECVKKGWSVRVVTPTSFNDAKHGRNPELAIQSLFVVEGRGLVFFDDMDIAIRDRETGETENQSIFLTAMDGVWPKEGVVHVFTTNCEVKLIDKAFKRPGRIDVIINVNPPDYKLKSQLIDKWHPIIQQNIDRKRLLAGTEDFSFAELEEIKNLLIQFYCMNGSWQLTQALQMFKENRAEFQERLKNKVGFGVSNEDD